MLDWVAVNISYMMKWNRRKTSKFLTMKSSSLAWAEYFAVSVPIGNNEIGEVEVVTTLMLDKTTIIKLENSSRKPGPIILAPVVLQKRKR